MKCGERLHEIVREEVEGSEEASFVEGNDGAEFLAYGQGGDGMVQRRRRRGFEIQLQVRAPDAAVRRGGIDGGCRRRDAG